MTPHENTVQQIFPLGAMAGRPISLLAALVAPAFAVIMAWQNSAEISSPWLALGSLVLICAASLTVIISSSSLRAPFTAQSALFVVIWANAGLILGAASMWNTDSFVRNDWGSTVVGIMILAVAPYRPPRELAIFGALSTILAGFVILLEADSFVTPVPPIVLVVVTTSPIIVLTLGSVLFTRVVILGILRWSKRATVAYTAAEEQDSDWIARSVQQDRVTILNRDIVPFFAAILHENTVTATDVERAREISDAIRSVMVAEVDRTWLHLVVEQAQASLAQDWLARDAVVDPYRLASRMTLDQRAGVRAFVGALFRHPLFRSRGFSAEFARRGNAVTVKISARLDGTEPQMKSELAPYFAVLRILFADLSVEFVQPALTLQFSYDD